MPKLKMTDLSLRQIKKPDAGQIDYFDLSYGGLALRVSAGDVRSWVYFGRVDGQLKRVTLGRYPAMSLADARRAAGAASDKMRAGVNPTTEKRAARIAAGEPVRDTFKAVMDEWLRRDQAGNRSAGEVRRLLEKDVLPRWLDKRVQDITRRDVIEAIDAIADRGVVTLARRIHAHLHRLFRWLVGRGVIDVNPMADLPKPGTDVTRDRVLSDVELVHVWNAAGMLGYPFGPLVRLLVLTGSRRDEIGALRWDEVDGDVIRLEGARTKNGKARSIPLSPPAVAILGALPRIAAPNTREAVFVFTSTGASPVSGWSRSKTILDRYAGENVAPFRIHDLRRTVATGLQRIGVRLEVVETILGHVSGSRSGVVGIYQRHEFAAESRDALDSWAVHVAGLVNKTTA